MAERVVIQSFVGDNASFNDLHALQEHFKDDLDFRRLPAQLQVLSNIKTYKQVTQLQHTVEAIRCIGIGERGLIPDVLTLGLKLCLVLPASTASAERSFSTLRRVKSYLRATMGQERLNHLLILNSYRELIDEMDVTKLLKCFVERNDFRRRIFEIGRASCRERV